MRTFIRGLFIPILFISFFTVSLFAQQAPVISLSPEKGFLVESADGFMGFRVGTMMQQQAGFSAPLNSGDALHSDLLIRRARIRLYGFFFENKLKYFLQLQMDKGSLKLTNAEYRWKATDHLQINVGQLWPVAGRQFRTISSHLQMIDRSPVTRFYMPGYDVGTTGQITTEYMKIYAGLTHGEGSNTATMPGGFAYSGRLELLPFGAFEANGDYLESDLVREETPKLSLGAALYYNHDAYHLMGNETWDTQSDDISSWHFDGLFKYNGFSLLTEFVHREVQNEILSVEGTTYISNILSGEGLSVQAGSFINKNLEPTLRFDILDPDDEARIMDNLFTQQETYSLGLNHFMRGHNMKIQCELDLVNEHYQNQDDKLYLQLLSQISITL